MLCHELADPGLRKEHGRRGKQHQRLRGTPRGAFEGRIEILRPAEFQRLELDPKALRRVARGTELRGVYGRIASVVRLAAAIAMGRTANKTSTFIRTNSATAACSSSRLPSV